MESVLKGFKELAGGLDSVNDKAMDFQEVQFPIFDREWLAVAKHAVIFNGCTSTVAAEELSFPTFLGTSLYA